MRHAGITPEQFSFDVTVLHQQGAWLLIYYKSFLTKEKNKISLGQMEHVRSLSSGFNH